MERGREAGRRVQSSRQVAVWDCSRDWAVRRSAGNPRNRRVLPATLADEQRTTFGYGAFFILKIAPPPTPPQKGGETSPSLNPSRRGREIKRGFRALALFLNSCKISIKSLINSNPTCFALKNLFLIRRSPDPQVLAKQRQIPFRNFFHSHFSGVWINLTKVS